MNTFPEAWNLLDHKAWNRSERVTQGAYIASLDSCYLHPLQDRLVFSSDFSDLKKKAARNRVFGYKKWIWTSNEDISYRKLPPQALVNPSLQLPGSKIPIPANRWAAYRNPRWGRPSSVSPSDLSRTIRHHNCLFPGGMDRFELVERFGRC